MRILVTGAAGFIGYHVCKHLSKNNEILAIDNFNDHYDPKIKFQRANDLESNFNIKVLMRDINVFFFNKEIEMFKPEVIIHLAARAGVRDSFSNSEAYFEDNIVGFYNILEICKNFGIKKILYASSSSVYGSPKDEHEEYCSETNECNKPRSFYAATKKCNEILAEYYSNAFDIRAIGMRFFTVYGPWGRPDMSIIKFMKSIMNEEEIELYNNGMHYRHFTFIDDIVKSISLLVNDEGKGHSAINVNCKYFYKLSDLISILEYVCGKKAKIKKLPMQHGDVLGSMAKSFYLENVYNFKPQIDLKNGIQQTFDWFIDSTKRPI